MTAATLTRPGECTALHPSDTLGGMQPSVPSPRVPSDPIGELLGYAREHSVALAELRGGMATVTAGHADHETRLRILEGQVTTALAQTKVVGVVSRLAWSVVLLGVGGVVTLVVERLAG